MKNFFDKLGKFMAIVILIVWVVLLANAIFSFIPETAVGFLNVLNSIRLYGGLILVGVVGLEAVSGRGFIVKLIVVALIAIVIIATFFPSVYNQLIAYLPAA